MSDTNLKILRLISQSRGMWLGITVYWMISTPGRDNQPTGKMQDGPEFLKKEMVDGEWYKCTFPLQPIENTLFESSIVNIKTTEDLNFSSQ